MSTPYKTTDSNKPIAQIIAKKRSLCFKLVGDGLKI
jgi:hypothetical protein